MTQERLADDMKVTKRSIIRWEMGGEIRLDMRERYALGLGWSLLEFSEALAADDGLEVVRTNYRRSVPSHLTHLVALEQGACELRTFEALAVPGLLQTRAYVTAVEQMSLVASSPEEVAQRVEFRLARHEALLRPSPLHLWTILDASVLLRVVGNEAVMKEQQEHLRMVSRLPNVHVRVGPLDGTVLAGPGTFQIVSNEAGPYIATTENLAGVQYLETPSVVDAYGILFEHLWQAAAPLA